MQGERLSKYLMRIGVLLQQTDLSKLPKANRDRIQIAAKGLKDRLDKLIDDINLVNEMEEKEKLLTTSEKVDIV